MTPATPRDPPTFRDGPTVFRDAHRVARGGEAGAAGVRFRRATNQDADLAERVVDGALREYGLHVLLDSSDVDLTDIERHYDARGGAFEIIEGPSGELLGVLGGRPTSGGVYELKKLYLVREARGRGLGRLSLERVVAAARVAGCRAVVLETSAALGDANRLYSLFGFVPVRGDDAATFATLSAQCDLAYRLDLPTEP
jgi:GNAT superfamily N-acetyltransferase